LNGLHFAADDPSALAGALQRCVAERETLLAWGEASRTRAAAWTPDAGAAKWIAAFQQLGLL
jgi:hypothetical protein